MTPFHQPPSVWSSCLGRDRLERLPTTEKAVLAELAAAPFGQCFAADSRLLALLMKLTGRSPEDLIDELPGHFKRALQRNKEAMDA